MNTSELAELFLTSLYDLAESEGHTKLFHLNDFATKIGVYDIGKITKAANILESRGLIYPVSYQVGGGVSASISGEGCLFVERGGETGIIQKYRQNPDTFIVKIDQSTNIHGNISHSSIAMHSQSVTQAVTINNDIQSIISTIADTLKADASLNAQDREDLLHDIETLNIQLAKNKKDRSFIDGILSNLSNVSSIASLVLQLGGLIQGL